MSTPDDQEAGGLIDFQEARDQAAIRHTGAACDAFMGGNLAAALRHARRADIARGFPDPEASTITRRKK